MVLKGGWHISCYLLEQGKVRSIKIIAQPFSVIADNVFYRMLTPKINVKTR